MSLFDVVLGKPLATSAEQDEHIGVAAGIPIFGLDGLTSAAYGPEAAMSLIIPLGIWGVSHYLLPIFTAILILLVIVYFSYRQTIEAYPNGGGSYTVASENLGNGAGLLAAAALMIDYILTAAVGVSAGVTALVSALPELHSHAPNRAWPRSARRRLSSDGGRHPLGDQGPSRCAARRRAAETARGQDRDIRRHRD